MAYKRKYYKRRSSGARTNVKPYTKKSRYTRFRKRPTKRRLTYRRSSSMPKVQRDGIFGQLNPFSGSHPRLLDGSACASQTHAFRFTTEFVVSANETGCLFLQPDILAATCFLKNVKHGFVTSTQTDDSEIGITRNNLIGDGAGGSMNKTGHIDRWRLVSQGMKLTLLNTDETNDGWFEAVRITDLPGNYEQQLWSSNNLYMYRTPHSSCLDLWSEHLRAGSLRQSPSYINGSLKDIHKLMLRLNPIEGYHPLKVIHENFPIGPGGLFTAAGQVEADTEGNPAYTGYQMWRPASEAATIDGWNEIRESFFDHSYDSVMVLIHSGHAGTKLLCDTVQNNEVVYETHSGMARFHKVGGTADVQTKVDKARSGVSAGTRLFGND